MHYSKIFVLVITLLTCITPCFAENWESAYCGHKDIYIDTDSVKKHDDGTIYYNVKYYDNNAHEQIIVTVQSKNIYYAGVVTSHKYSAYQNNKNIADTNTSEVTKAFTKLTSSSPLYVANGRAHNIQKNKDNVNKAKTPSFTPTPKISKMPSNLKSPLSQTLSEPDFGPYMKNLQRRIKNNWQPPRGQESKRVVLLFKIAKDGRLLSCSVHKSSGSPAADNAAINAVKITAPFSPLPANFKGAFVDIQFTFDYNVYNSN